MRKQRQLNENTDNFYFNVWVRDLATGVDTYIDLLEEEEAGTLREAVLDIVGGSEWILSDWECTLDNAIGQYASVDELERVAEIINEAKNGYDLVLLAAQGAIDMGMDLLTTDLEDTHILENTENTISLDADLGYTWENHVGLDFTDKENYFDYEAYGRDIRISGDLDSFIAEFLLYGEEILDGKNGWDVVNEENADLIVDDYLRERVNDLFTMGDYELGLDFTEDLDPRELPTNYFDYEAFGRDLSYDYTYVTVDAHGHLFLDGWVRF